MQQAKNLFISVIIPCFNEEQVIAHTYERVNKTMQSFEHRGYELIFINDGSRDKTLELLRVIAQKRYECKNCEFFEKFWTSTRRYCGHKYLYGRCCHYH